MMLEQATAFAPASVGNVGVGFDILGHTIVGPGDRATVRRIEAPKVRIAAIRGCAVELPLEAARNTAGAALIAMIEDLKPPFGFEIELDKGIAYGSGMGGSAASCVAALVAANALLDSPLTREQLYPYALAGEAVASGGYHGDNVGAMLLGGIVLATPDRLVRIPAPSQVALCTCAPRSDAGNAPRARGIEGRLCADRVHRPEHEPCAGAQRLSSRRCRPGSRRTARCADRTPARVADSGFRPRQAGSARSPRTRREHFRRRPERVRLVRLARRGRTRGTGDARRLRGKRHSAAKPSSRESMARQRDSSLEISQHAWRRARGQPERGDHGRHGQRRRTVCAERSAETRCHRVRRRCGVARNRGPLARAILRRRCARPGPHRNLQRGIHVRSALARTADAARSRPRTFPRPDRGIQGLRRTLPRCDHAPPPARRVDTADDTRGDFRRHRRRSRRGVFRLAGLSRRDPLPRRPRIAAPGAPARLPRRQRHRPARRRFVR